MNDSITVWPLGPIFTPGNALSVTIVAARRLGLNDGQSVSDQMVGKIFRGNLLAVTEEMDAIRHGEN